MPYDRDTVVRGMGRYYDLLAKLAYLDESDILRPPTAGWSDEQVMVEMLARAGRSDAVKDLVKHLPYIRSDREREIYLACRAVSYLRGNNCVFEENSPEEDAMEFHERLMPCEGYITPRGMIALASDLRTDAWLLDVDEGVIYSCDSTLVDENASEEEPWKRCGRRNSIQHFFNKVCGHLESLLLIPVPEPVEYFEGGKTSEGKVSRVLQRAIHAIHTHSTLHELCKADIATSDLSDYWQRMVGRKT